MTFFPLLELKFRVVHSIDVSQIFHRNINNLNIDHGEVPSFEVKFHH